jgi:hypothetical protein
MALSVALNIKGAFGGPFGAAVGWAMGGTVGGLFTGLALHRREPLFRWTQACLIAIVFAVSGAIGGALSWEMNSAIGGFLGGMIAGGFGGLIMGNALKLIRPPNRLTPINMIAIGWALGGGLGGAVSWAFHGYQYTTIFYATIGAITGVMIGGIGGGLMFWCLSHERKIV